MYCELNEGKIYYELDDKNSSEDKRPILMLVPGGPGVDLTHYKPMFSKLNDTYRMLFFDQRGSGKSLGFDSTSLSIFESVTDIEALRVHLGLNNFFLLGLSYGAMVAIGYAVKYSKHLSGLVSIAGTPTYQFLNTAKDNLLKRGTEEQIKYANKYLWTGKFTNKNSFYEYFEMMGSLYSVNPPKKLPKKKIGDIEPFNAAFSNDFWRFDFTDGLNNILCPSLILAGNKDWIIDPKYSEIMSEKINNSNLILYESGHSMMADVSDEMLADIRNFCSSII